MVELQAAWHTAMQDTAEYGVAQLSERDHNEVYDHFIQNERHYNPHDLMERIDQYATAPPGTSRATTKQSPATPPTYRSFAETPVFRPDTDPRRTRAGYEQPSSWATHTTTSTTTTTITTAATRTTCNTASPAAQPRTATYFVPTRTRPTPTPQPDPSRGDGNHAATTDSTTPLTANKTKLSPELQQLTDSLQSMGQNIAQNLHQNINQLTQATADQARTLGHETQEMVNTTLADQHQRYVESAERIEQNINAINDQYLGDTQRQEGRIDQVASLIDATERSLEERLERVQQNIQAHTQNVARVHRESQRRADTRPDTSTRKAPPVANYVPRRQPQPTAQTRPDPKHATKTNSTPNQPAKAATRQATNQAPPDEQARGTLPDGHQNTVRATPLANSTADEEAAPPLTGKELWQGTERVRKMTGTFTPKKAAYDGTKGKHHEEFASFAKKFEYMANYYQIPKANWAHMFATCLATSAHDEYLAMSKEHQNDYEQTIAHLGKIYPAPTRNEWTYRNQWDALRQAPNEPLREFIGRIESLAHKAHTSLNSHGLENEKIMKFRYGLASSYLRYDLAAVMAETLQELGSRAIAIQMSRDADPATMRVGTTEMSEVARDLGTVPTGMIRTAQLEPQPTQMVEVTRLPYAYPHTMPPATTCVTYVPAPSFTASATPPPPQSNLHENFPKKRQGDYQRGMDLALVQCYNCGERGHLANKCPRPDKRLRPGYRGANRGRGSRGGNRTNGHTDNRQSSDAHTLLAPTSEPQNVPSAEQLPATQDPIGRQHRAQGVPTNADLDRSMDDVGFDPLMSSDSRRAMIRFASADLTSPRSKSPVRHAQALTTEEETERPEKLLTKQEKAAPPATLPEVPKPFGASAVHGFNPSLIEHTKLSPLALGTRASIHPTRMDQPCQFRQLHDRISHEPFSTKPHHRTAASTALEFLGPGTADLPRIHHAEPIFFPASTSSLVPSFVNILNLDNNVQWQQALHQQAPLVHGADADMIPPGTSMRVGDGQAVLNVREIGDNADQSMNDLNGEDAFSTVCRDCAIGEKSFDTLFDLIKHSKRCVHFKRYSCEYCDVGSNEEHNLRLHVALHFDVCPSTSESAISSADISTTPDKGRVGNQRKAAAEPATRPGISFSSGHDGTSISDVSLANRDGLGLAAVSLNRTEAGVRLVTSGARLGEAETGGQLGMQDSDAPSRSLVHHSGLSSAVSDQCQISNAVNDCGNGTVVTVVGQNRVDKSKVALSLPETGGSVPSLQNSTATLDPSHGINTVQGVIGQSKDARIMRCPECKRVFARFASFKCHLKLHEIDDAAICATCGEEFIYWTELRCHERKVHAPSVGRVMPAHFCSRCGTIFANEEKLKEHMAVHRRTIKRSLHRPRAKASDRKHRRISASGFKVCPHCNKAFTAKAALDRHVRIHTDERPYVCQTCGKAFRQPGALKTHELTHSEDKQFKCPECDAAFAQKGNLKKHIRKVHPEDPDSRYAFPCPFCTGVFRARKFVLQHCSKMHDFDSFQGLSSQQQAAATEALRGPNSEGDAAKNDAVKIFISNPTSTSGEILKRYSPETVVTVIDVTKALKTKKPNNAQTNSMLHSELRNIVIERRGKRTHYFCPHGDVKTEKPSDLVRHVRKHTGVKPYSCPVCERRFVTRSNVRQHMDTHMVQKVPGTYPECYICRKAFTRNGQLQAHLRLHQGKSGDSTGKCGICGRLYRNQGNLTAQMKRVHKNNARLPHVGELIKKNYLVNEEGDCQATTPLRSTPETIRRPPANSDGRRFKCRLCQWSFLRSDHLKTHMRCVHLFEKPLACSMCNPRFVSYSNLKLHIRSHVGIRNSHCWLCAASFLTRSQLRRHLSKHTNEKPFPCPYCEKRFSRGVLCRKHMKSHRTNDILRSYRMKAVSFRRGAAVPNQTHERPSNAFFQEDLSSYDALEMGGLENDFSSYVPNMAFGYADTSGPSFYGYAAAHAALSTRRESGISMYLQRFEARFEKSMEVARDSTRPDGLGDSYEDSSSLSSETSENINEISTDDLTGSPLSDNQRLNAAKFGYPGVQSLKGKITKPPPGQRKPRESSAPKTASVAQRPKSETMNSHLSFSRPQQYEHSSFRGPPTAKQNGHHQMQNGHANVKSPVVPVTGIPRPGSGASVHQPQPGQYSSSSLDRKRGVLTQFNPELTSYEGEGFYHMGANGMSPTTLAMVSPRHTLLKTGTGRALPNGDYQSGAEVRMRHSRAGGHHATNGHGHAVNGNMSRSMVESLKQGKEGKSSGGRLSIPPQQVLQEHGWNGHPQYAALVAAQQLPRSSSSRSCKSESPYASLITRREEHSPRHKTSASSAYSVKSDFGVTSPARGVAPVQPFTGNASTPYLNSVLARVGMSPADVEGSQWSLASPTTNEERHQSEIRKLSREIDQYKVKVQTLETQLSTYDSVVSAFEHSSPATKNRLTTFMGTFEEKDQQLSDRHEPLNQFHGMDKQSGIQANTVFSPQTTHRQNSDPVTGSTPPSSILTRQPAKESMNSLISQRSSVSNVSSNMPQNNPELLDKKAKKGWLRSLFTRAFAKSRRTSKQGSIGASPPDVEEAQQAALAKKTVLSTEPPRPSKMATVIEERMEANVPESDTHAIPQRKQSGRSPAPSASCVAGQ